MTATQQVFHVPLMPVPFRRGCGRMGQELWWSWRDGFRFWMDIRKAAKPTGPYRVAAVVRRGQDARMIPVDDRHLADWREGIVRAVSLWAGVEPVEASVSFGPLDGPMTTDRERRAGVYITIEEDQ
jgi:hypothetical protein